MKTLPFIFSMLFMLFSTLSFAQWQVESGKIFTNNKVGLNVENPESILDINGSIHFIGSTLIYNGGPQSDGFRIGYTNEFSGIQGRDYLLIEKKDANGNDPDGGIAFVNTGQDGLASYSMVINGKNQIGINTADPKETIDINGQIRLSDRSLSGIYSLDSKISLRTNPTGRFGRSFFELWGNEGERAGEILMGGKYIRFLTNKGTNDYGFERMRITADGKLGIGTSSPQEGVDITHRVRLNHPTFGGWIYTPGKNLSLSTDKWGSTSRSFITLFANEKGKEGSIDLGGQYIRFLTGKTTSNYGTEAMRIQQNGGIGMGTSAVPSGYRLAVDGKIIAEELKVELSQSWPDYVFSPEYDLKSLEETEAYIDENGHLPGIPSSTKIETQGGVNVGEMQRLMMEKMEEMMLHLIELKKENKRLKARLSKLENQ